jgi:nucleoside-diphosphate-sugar epimerase
MSLPVTDALGPGSVVAVTGVGGFLASTLTQQLLARGCAVRGTLRDPSNAKKTAHLLALPGAAERLSFHKADLVAEGAEAAFAAAFAGCSVVFHTACAFASMDEGKRLGRDFYERVAAGGTRTVLAAAERAGARRVVVTSSTAAIFKRLVAAPHTYTEADWNDVEELATREYWYAVGKTLQERAVWAFVEERRPAFSAVSINPTLIGGPQLAPEVNTSTSSVLEYFTGKAKVPNAGIPWVDVRDVAAAHVAAAERGGAQGRYLMIAFWDACAQMADALRRVSPPALAARVPTELDLAPGAEPVSAGKGISLHDSSRATRELGVSYRGLDEIMRGSVDSLVAHGFLKE